MTKSRWTRRFLVAAISAGILLSALAASATEYPRYSSGVKTSSAQIKAGPSKFYGVIVTTDGSHAATIVCYNSPTADGKELFPTITIPAAQGAGGITFESELGIAAPAGIYCTLTGTGAKYVVYSDAAN